MLQLKQAHGKLQWHNADSLTGVDEDEIYFKQKCRLIIINGKNANVRVETNQSANIWKAASDKIWIMERVRIAIYIYIWCITNRGVVRYNLGVVNRGRGD